MDPIPSQPDRCQQERVPPDHNDLPTLLAEYGHLAAQLPSASRAHAEGLHVRLAELDELIDHHVVLLSQRDEVVDS